MPGWAVIPTVRVPDMGEAIDFYVGKLGFELARGGPEEVNNSLTRGDARIMLEVPSELFSDGYNAEIRQRLGGRSAVALYMEAPDLEALYERLQAEGVTIVDPIAPRPWGQVEFTVEDHVGTWLTFWDAPEKSGPQGDG
ncbi:MAG TPA: VOC family protein [Trueperaceae bacterium]|nr:VOC family protein [Trueperaceae bacterium]